MIDRRIFQEMLASGGSVHFRPIPSFDKDDPTGSDHFEVSIYCAEARRILGHDTCQRLICGGSSILESERLTEICSYERLKKVSKDYWSADHWLIKVVTAVLSTGSPIPHEGNILNFASNFYSFFLSWLSATLSWGIEVSFRIDRNMGTVIVEFLLEAGSEEIRERARISGMLLNLGKESVIAAQESLTTATLHFIDNCTRHRIDTF